MRPRKLKPALPKLSPDLKLRPHDFLAVLKSVPEGCPMIGGQAVAYWANRYRIVPENEPITSKDIDFWGSREDLTTLAKRLQRPPIFPESYEMTVWAGAVEILVAGKTTLVEMLHTVPGLDTNEPKQAAVKEHIEGAALYILSPVSLVLAKLHALRNFDQQQRKDKLHLLASIECAAHFISELLARKHVRLALQECERIIRSRSAKAIQRLQQEQGFDLLSAIPVAAMEAETENPAQETANRERLRNFLKKRWPSIRKHQS